MSSEPTYDVAIIGAGFSGSMVAVNLLGNQAAVGTVALIEKGGEFGRGVAYGTSCPRHLLNVPAGKMSAFPDQPDHFLNWLRARAAELEPLGLALADAGTFVPRMIYGCYIVSLLAEAQTASGQLKRLSGEAIDVQPLTNGELRIELSDGERLRARKVVLALGNFPPGNPRLNDRRFHESPRYLNSPWSASTSEELSGTGDILILGSGLTSLDLLLSLEHTKESGTIHVLSRRGLFPQPHQPVTPYPPFLNSGSLPRTVREIFRRVRKEVGKAAAAGSDWRAVIDSLRPLTQELWRGLPILERRRFFRHLRPYWEAHRHRASRDVLSVKARLERSGRLRCHRGRVQEIREEVDGFYVSIGKPPGAEPVTLRVQYVLNCTGPESNYHNLQDPLVLQLFARGLIRPDPLFLGLDVAPGGAVLNARGEQQGNVFTLGSPQKGMIFETTAVPELRVQAQDLARVLLRDLARTAAKLPDDLQPDPAYTYEI
ncbi:MAG TPA: FAD/NAD(P)-binding protein [Chthoniobacterales bacterium]|jgi:uncharacterized NAD(P)/FAD-binding protein YdhS